MSQKIFRPMKAPSESLRDFAVLPYPCLASPKFDGLRGVGYGGLLLSNSMAPFRNEYLNEVLRGGWLDGLDGELIVGAPNGDDVLKRAKQGITAGAGMPDFRWHLFDDFSRPELPYEQRLGRVFDRVAKLPAKLGKFLVPTAHASIKSAKDLHEYEQWALAQKYEGAMVRDPAGPYKFGRCTFMQGWLYKLKRFEDAEALVVRLEEGNQNTNEAQIRGDGAIKRSTRREGLVPNGMVGCIIGMDLKTGQEKRIMPGCMTAAERIHYWEHKEELLQHVVTYKHFPYGAGDAGRHMTFKCIRPTVDIAP